MISFNQEQKGRNMKIREIEIVSGPNIYWYIATVVFVVAGGWKGLLIWTGINVLFIIFALVIYKPLRVALFHKAGT